MSQMILLIFWDGQESLHSMMKKKLIVNTYFEFFNSQTASRINYFNQTTKLAKGTLLST